MKKLLSMALAGALFLSVCKMHADVKLSRALLCVKNIAGTNVEFANYASGSYAQWQTMAPNQVYSRYVSPFRFNASNILDDNIYLYYKIGNPAAQGEYKTTDIPKSYGSFKNSMIFERTAPKSVEVFICSIRSAGGTTCKAVKTVSLAGLTTPQAYCEVQTYP